jgi:hypothetical protein
LSDIEDDDSENESENQFIKKEHGEYFDWMEYRVSNYEYLQDNVAPLLELALWKAKMEEQSNSNLLDEQMKLRCRFDSLSMVSIIIPNTLSFL